ncbi:MAG: hypothetical protein Q9227_004681 [Pyrenula ochraceoflavens]
MGDIGGDAAYATEWLETDARRVPQLEKHSGGRQTMKGGISAQEARGQYNFLLATAAQRWPPVEGVETRDETIDGKFSVRIYTPAAASSQKLPVALWYHGGGWISGDLASEDPLCRRVAASAPCIVVSVDYRLCPEHPMPTPIDDAVTAFNWAYGQAEKLNGDQSKVICIGGSAGGGIAFATVNALIKAGQKDKVQGVVAFNPIAAHPQGVPAGFESMYTAWEENAEVPFITKYSLELAFGKQFLHLLLNDILSGRLCIAFHANPLTMKPPESAGISASTGAAPDLLGTQFSTHASFPPTHLITCGRDVTRDDALIFEAQLQKAGVRVTRDHFEEYPHYFFVFPMLKAASEFIGKLTGGVNGVLGA